MRIDEPYRGKRTFDVVLLLLVGWPALALGAVCALAIRITSPGPVFFHQERIGRDGVPFRVHKFRTMVPGDNPIFPDATLITPIGRLLRRTSLDELPQLLNVARGEMSVVGPRPTLAYQIERYDERQRRRLAVRPGLSGLAQVHGRNALAGTARIELDVLTDIRILVRTASSMLSGDGVEGHPTDDPLAKPSTE